MRFILQPIMDFDTFRDIVWSWRTLECAWSRSYQVGVKRTRIRCLDYSRFYGFRIPQHPPIHSRKRPGKRIGISLPLREGERGGWEEWEFKWMGSVVLVVEEWLGIVTLIYTHYHTHIIIELFFWRFYLYIFMACLFFSQTLPTSSALSLYRIWSSY